jgi:hypothetical protein
MATVQEERHISQQGEYSSNILDILDFEYFIRALQSVPLLFLILCLRSVSDWILAQLPAFEELNNIF